MTWNKQANFVNTVFRIIMPSNTVWSEQGKSDDYLLQSDSRFRLKQSQCVIFCLILLKQGNVQARMLRKRTECVSRLSSVNMFCFDTNIYMVINWCSNEASVNICLSVKTRGSGHAFSQRNRLQIEAMVWFICATLS